MHRKISKIAIIGSGISGLTSAYLLHEKYDITLFEANNYIGGHTNTVMVKEGGVTIPIDTGFIVFNEQNYPNFMQLLDKLNVEKQKSNMSFGFSSTERRLEYSGNNLRGVFAQRRNLFHLRFY